MRTLLPLLALAACGAPAEIPEDEYAHWLAQAVCARTRECARGLFDSAYYGLADCEETNERAFLATVDQRDQQDCDYSAADAGNAYADILEMSCEHFYEGDGFESANDAWDDCPVYTYGYVP